MTTLSTSIPGETPAPGTQAVAVGNALIGASQRVLDTLGGVRTSSELIQAIGIKKDVASRFLTALSKRDPLAVVYYMPGVESLRLLTRNARAKLGDHDSVRLFEDAVTTFENFLQNEMGGRPAFDAMASAWLPEARDRFELTSRQMAFRAMANLCGIECETSLNTVFVHPGEDSDWVDGVELQGISGIRRLRPSIPLVVAVCEHFGESAGRQKYTVDGRQIRAADAPLDLLPAFGSGDPAAIRVVRAGTSVRYEFVDQTLGTSKASDVFLGQFTKSLYSKHCTTAAHGAYTDVPSRRLVIDLLVHKDLWPEVQPELMLFNTVYRGLVLDEASYRTRAGDQMDLRDTVRRVGVGIDHCRVAEVPRYTDLLQWTCRQRGWDPNSFRAYRCDSRYPVFGVQYTMVIPVRTNKPSNL